MALKHTPIATYIDNAVLLKYQPILSQYYPGDKTNYDEQIAEAEYLIMQMLRNNKKDLRKYTTPLELQSSVAKTSSFTGSKSDEDIVNRLMFVLVSTALGGTETFTIEGTNDDSSETWVTLVNIEQTSTATGNQIFNTPYKYYRVTYSGTTATYSAYLIETSFFFAHLYKSLELIYRFLMSTSEDRFESLANYYEDKFQNMMDTMLATYDEDLSGVIESTEQDRVTEANWSR